MHTFEQQELVELLFEQPYSIIEFVVNKSGVERKAASRYLKECCSYFKQTKHMTTFKSKSSTLVRIIS
ncbi:MAG: hypothetical protein ACOXZV_04380 [Bacteroidales bacterium]